MWSSWLQSRSFACGYDDADGPTKDTIKMFQRCDHSSTLIGQFPLA
jgi:hypothetical protein